MLKSFAESVGGVLKDCCAETAEFGESPVPEDIIMSVLLSSHCAVIRGIVAVGTVKPL